MADRIEIRFFDDNNQAQYLCSLSFDEFPDLLAALEELKPSEVPIHESDYM